MSCQRNILIGIIGFGHMARRHIDFINIIFPDVQIIVLTKLEVSDRPAGFSGIKFLHSFNEFIKIKYDIIVDASYPSRRLNNLCLMSGFQGVILLEKPMSQNYLDAKKMQKVILDSNLNVVVGYNLRFMDGYRSLKQKLETKSIGDLLKIDVTVGQDLASWRPGRKVEEVVSGRKSCGGGALRELSHELDLICSLFGIPQVRSASISRQKYLTLDVEDTVVTTLVFQQHNDLICSLNMDFIRLNKTRSITVIGTDGTLTWNLVSGKN